MDYEDTELEECAERVGLGAEVKAAVTQPDPLRQPPAVPAVAIEDPTAVPAGPTHET